MSQGGGGGTCDELVPSVVLGGWGLCLGTTIKKERMSGTVAATTAGRLGVARFPALACCCARLSFFMAREVRALPRRPQGEAGR